MFRSNEQKEFAQRIRTHINAPDAPLLLEGATGRGKTRAYLHPLFERGKRASICLATGEAQSSLSDMIEPAHHGDVYFSFAIEHDVGTDEWLQAMVDEINGVDGLTLVVTPSHALAQHLGDLLGLEGLRAKAKEKEDRRFEDL